MTELIKVYVQTDALGRIIAVNSSAFLTDTEDWTQIDEGTEWPRYMHAQGYYFPQPIMTEDGIYRYKLVNGAPVLRTEAEMQADRDARPAPPPTPQEDLEAMAIDHEYRLTLLELGV